ncbi:MAG TPA: aminotransferase class V-fold PLP-dependent enzyme [Gemmatimonadota bacterium]|nr:aminotransferase class V-fold PLP-dependent enzyme [Gemmatimonadota bacterium]
MSHTKPLAPFAELLAAEYPRTGDGIFLNSAAQGILPRRTLDAMARFEAERAYPNRIDDAILLDVETTCRERVARLVGATPGLVGLAVNTSEGINVASLHLPLSRGERVLVARGEFPANVYPWLSLGRRGVETVFLEKEGAHLDVEQVAEMLDADPAIRAVSMSLVQFSNGHRNPVEAVGRACKERGVYFVVDGMQGLGAVELDWSELHADVLACGGQKWLCAPWGSGFFVVAEWMCADVDPVRVGWLQVAGARNYQSLCDYELRFERDARRFEVGTYPYTALLGLSESLDLIDTLGVARIAAHSRALLARLEEGLFALGATVVSCMMPDCRSSILCFRADDEAATRTIHGGLLAGGVTCALREGSIRLSPHFYNTAGEIDRVLEMVETAWHAPARAR